MEEAQRLCDRVAIMNNGKILIQGSPSELVERFIEPQVFEVYGTGLNDWSSQLEFKPELRTERVGETVFCYCNEENNLIDELRDKKSLRYIRRPANLEDVFLKLTGRELRE